MEPPIDAPERRARHVGDLLVAQALEIAKDEDDAVRRGDEANLREQPLGRSLASSLSAGVRGRSSGGSSSIFEVAASLTALWTR